MHKLIKGVVYILFRTNMNTEQKNIEELTKMNERIYTIAQEYGSNTKERYELLTAYDRMFDAIAELEENNKFHTED